MNIIKTGKLVFHSYDNYGDGSSKLYLHNFDDNETFFLNLSKSICDPMNAVFDKTGKFLFFMAKTNNKKWDIYSYNLSNKNTKNLTKNLNDINEDPKISKDGKYLVYKADRNHIRISELVLDSNNVYSLSNDRVLLNLDNQELSMPVLSLNNKFLCFVKSNETNKLNVYRVKLDDNLNSVLDSLELICDSAYYPIYKDYSSVLFTKVEDGSDKICKFYTEEKMFGDVYMNINNYDNFSDICVVDESTYILSSTTQGSYQLFISTKDNRLVKLLTSVAIPGNMLGSDYHKD